MVINQFPIPQNAPQLAASAAIVHDSTAFEYAPNVAASWKDLTAAQRHEANLAYIEKHTAAAKAVWKQSGVPVAITLAQGLHESAAGLSRLATENNNHFGHKCFSTKCEKGHCTNHKDDSHKDFFRVYLDTETAFKAHGQFLQKPRYKTARYCENDVTCWAKQLFKCGYATDKKYSKKLIAKIKKYNLDKIE